MGNVNKVFLMGNMTRDPELRYTPNGTAVCDFGLAVNRSYTTRDREKRDETCFVDVTVWGRRGEIVSEYFSKGRLIFIEGRLKFDTWETADGRRSKLTVVAEDFQFVERRGGEPGAGPQQSDSAKGGDRAGSPPSGRARGQAPSRQEEPPAETSEESGYDVSDDEIPF